MPWLLRVANRSSWEITSSLAAAAGVDAAGGTGATGATGALRGQLSIIGRCLLLSLDLRFVRLSLRFLIGTPLLAAGDIPAHRRGGTCDDSGTRCGAD